MKPADADVTLFVLNRLLNDYSSTADSSVAVLEEALDIRL
jgi:hypothetical protein